MEKVKQQKVLYGNINRNLIGIQGKMGSGKDTVGSIIQYLTTQKYKGITCSYEEFKGSTLEMLSPYSNKKMAGKLKQIASILTDIPVEKFEDQEFKKTYLGEEWNTDFIEVEDKCSGRMTVREFLQKLGTDAIRNGLHEDTWLNAFWIDYIPKPDKTPHEAFQEELIYGKSEIRIEYPNWIITDCRFENEYNSIKERGGLMIKVGRPNIETQSHASETGLDHITSWDYIIENSGTIDELIEKVREILIKEGII